MLEGTIELHVICTERADADWQDFLDRYAGATRQDASVPVWRHDGSAKARARVAVYERHVGLAAHSNLTQQQRLQRENPRLKDDFFLDEQLARLVRECVWKADAELHRRFCKPSSKPPER